jgi:hypothetical protein
LTREFNKCNKSDLVGKKGKGGAKGSAGKSKATAKDTPGDEEGEDDDDLGDALLDEDQVQEIRKAKATEKEQAKMM